MPSQAWPAVLGLGAFLTVGILISFLYSRNPKVKKRYSLDPKALAGRPPLSGARGPGVMSTNIVGLMHFKSAAAKMGIIPGVMVAIGAIPGAIVPVGGDRAPLLIVVPTVAGGLLVAVLAYLRPKGAVQSLNVDEDGAITLMRGDVQFPFDFAHYRYVRMDCSSMNTVGFGSGPQMLVLYQDSPPTILKRWGSICFPRVNQERAVLFFHSWRTAEGYAVVGYDLAALFYQACEHAGRKPREVDHFFAKPSWEVRPDTDL